MSDAPYEVEDDGLFTPEIKPHSLEKIRLHNRYASIFATSMKGVWPQLGYIGLYSGAGRARLSGTNRVVETSSLAVLRQPNPFTDYVFVDSDERCIDALSKRINTFASNARISVISKDVNVSIEDVKRALPAYSKTNGLLSFCFVDPFDLQLRFRTISQLAHLRMDFLVLLMLGVDGRRNFKRYLQDESNTRIGDFVGHREWRSDYRAGSNVIHFLIRRFDLGMQRLGYLSAVDDAHVVKIQGMGVLQYVLAFYSKSPLGQHFWKESRSSLSPQLSLL
jgi:three-Cys-motif partner protein